MKKQLWPPSKLQFEYAGSKINFDDLEFNLFVAGELEMLSSSKISEVEIIGRTKLLKRIAYFTELYEWKGLKKLYAHIIRQIENGLADWPKDFGEVETPLLINMLKMMLKVERVEINSVNIRKTQRKKRVLFFIVLAFKEKNIYIPRLIMETSRELKGFYSIFVLLVIGKTIKRYFTQCSDNCPHQHN